MSFVMFAVAHFLFRKHKKVTKKVLMHTSTVLMAVDCLKAVGVLMIGGAAMEHVAHVCGASGALIGAVACYLD